MEPWLVGWASTGPREATLALPLPCGRRLSKGPARPFLPISVSTVSLLLVSTPGGLLPRPLPARLLPDSPGLRGRSRFLSALCLSSLPFLSPRGGPHPSAPTDRQGGRRALAACGDGADLSPAVPVKVAPQGEKARAVRWPALEVALGLGPRGCVGSRVRAGHREGTGGAGARCEKSQCPQEPLGVRGRGLRRGRASWEGA